MSGPPRLSLRVLARGLPGNVGAQSVALAVQLVVALISVPVFSGLWGVERFGVWLILYTLPAYISLADFGFVGASANAISAAMARGETAAAARQFRALTAATFWGSLALLGTLAFAIAWADSRWLDFAQPATGGEAPVVVVALAAYALVALGTRTLHGALRATGHFAVGSYVIGATALLDLLLAAAIAAYGGGLAGAALGYALGQATGMVVMVALVRRLGGPLQASIREIELRSLSPLWRPAVALTLVAGAHALILQGIVLVIGGVAGAAAVPAFVAVRTLARLGSQGVAVMSQAVLPEMTIARARHDHERGTDLAALNLAFAAVFALPYAIALAILGPAVVRLWSGGVIVASHALTSVMAASAIAASCWGPLASFLSAENRQTRYAGAMLGFATCSLILAWPLTQLAGLCGAAVAALAFDLACTVWIGREAWHAGFIDAKTLREAPRRAWVMARSR